MEKAKGISSLIEAVDPEDSEKLAEIDARVEAYLSGSKFEKLAGTSLTGEKQYQCDNQSRHSFRGYTRSRDALKAIRPEGWCLERVQTDDRLGYSFILTKMNAIGWGAHIKTPDFKWFKTEELAELHAIIQAIEYEGERTGRVHPYTPKPVLTQTIIFLGVILLRINHLVRNITTRWV